MVFFFERLWQQYFECLGGVCFSIDFSAVYECFLQSVLAGLGVDADFCRLIAGLVCLLYFVGFAPSRTVVAPPNSKPY